MERKDVCFCLFPNKNCPSFLCKDGRKHEMKYLGNTWQETHVRIVTWNMTRQSGSDMIRGLENNLFWHTRPTCERCGGYILRISVRLCRGQHN